MRAIIIATGYKSSLASLMHFMPSPMLCIVDKPILFHVLDFLSALKITQYDLILNHLPHLIEKKVGDGNRWGIEITYHLVRDADHPLALVKVIASRRKEELLLLATGDGLPDINLLSYKEPFRQPLLWMYPHHPWSGWGVVTGDMLQNVTPSDTLKDLPGRLPQGVKSVYTIPFINCESLFELRDSNMRFLKAERPSAYFPANARLISPGLWIAHGASIHPTAKILAPAYIGENCQIEKNSRIGPQVVIEHHCMIDTGSEISNSLIMQKSYLGESLQVHNCIIVRNLLINLSIKSEVTIRDDFILSELRPPSLSRLPLKICECLIASGLFILCLPIYLYLKFRYKESRYKVLALPANANASEWQTFDLRMFEFDDSNDSGGLAYCLRRLPLLMNIMRSEIHFVGVTARTPEETAQLPPEWKNLYLKSKIGLITLADLDGGTSTSIDDRYTAEMYYAVQQSSWFDMKLIFRWLKQKIFR